MGTLAEGIKEIFATAKTTGSNVMLCGNDGTPDGHMTMDNLASVLGELPGGLYNSLIPFNIDTFYNGMVSLNNSNSQNITGVCPQTDMRGSLYSQCSLVYGSRFGTQTFVYFSNNSAPIIVYKRNLWANDWSTWQRCDNFGFNTLSDLANALGAITTEFSYCHRHNAGELTAEFCDYVDNEMQTSYQPRLVMIDTNSFGAAFGIKTNKDYCAFVIVSYEGIYSAIKYGGSWSVQLLSSK